MVVPCPGLRQKETAFEEVASKLWNSPPLNLYSMDTLTPLKSFCLTLFCLFWFGLLFLTVFLNCLLLMSVAVSLICFFCFFFVLFINLLFLFFLTHCDFCF